MSMTKQEILAELAAGKLDVNEADRLLSTLEVPQRGSLYCKVSPKCAMSLYGLQRMPVTLYVEQWERLLDFAEDIRAFLKQHEGELKRKQR
jgi:hypothetical protein